MAAKYSGDGDSVWRTDHGTSTQDVYGSGGGGTGLSTVAAAPKMPSPVITAVQSASV